MILAALFIAAADVASPAGFYRSSQIEVGAALELEQDGSFLYQLDYGAVSESAEGRWTSDGTAIYLTSTRMTGSHQAQAFARKPLKIDGDRLLLNRYDTVIRFEREDLPAPVDRKIWGEN